MERLCVVLLEDAIVGQLFSSLSLFASSQTFSIIVIIHLGRQHWLFFHHFSIPSGGEHFCLSSLSSVIISTQITNGMGEAAFLKRFLIWGGVGR